MMTTIDRHRPAAATPLAPQMVMDPRAMNATAETEAEPGIGELMARLHLMMRGRYLICSLLALMLGAALGYAGFKLGERTYRSMGQIRIVPTLPRIMYETEDKGVMPMFDSFVQTQVSLIKTQRVIEIALEDRSWPSPPARDDASVALFASRLNVLRDNELIGVSYESTDPVFAQMAVKNVISAYRRLYTEADGRENEQVLNELTQRQTTLSNQLETNRARVRAIAEAHGSDDITLFFKRQLDAVEAKETKLAQLQDLQATQVAQLTSPNGLDEDALGARDSILAKRLADRDTANFDLRAMRAQFGPNHPTVEKATLALAAADAAVADRVAKLKGLVAGTGQKGNDFLGDQIEKLTADVANDQQKLKTLGQEQLQMTQLRNEAEGLNDRLAQTKHRIEELNTEAPVSTGRITVISDGDRPLAPAKDTRKIFAGAGGLFGFVLPFGMALLLASADRRYGAPEETRMSTITRDLVLGALPIVDEGRFDAETSTLAAHCLHQVRTMLQIRCNGHAKSIAITSSRASSGKTSVVLGLGVSYAISGSKTLLIDLDLVGGGLTRRAEIQARARLGNLLVAQGLVSAEQLDQALELAKEKQIRLGAAFVEGGFLRPEQLDAVLADQKRSHAGLMDALYGAPLTECVTNGGTAGLDILPLGSANAHDAATLSPAEIKSLIDEAKTLYDTVLIDTGPVPGSLEASMVASLTDGVLLIVARGEPRSGAEASINHLRRIGGRVTGLVFNRAKLGDAGLIGGSLYTGGQSLRPSAERPPTPAARQAASARFGPVGQAVMDLAPGAISTD